MVSVYEALQSIIGLPTCVVRFLPPRGLMSLTEEQVDRVWSYVARTCPAMLALFDSLDLRLSGERCARALGLPSGAALKRWLAVRHLPRFRTLRDWYYLTLIRSRAEAKSSLAALAKERSEYPSILYRYIERIAGESWGSIHQLEEKEMRRRCVEVWTSERPSLRRHAEP